MALRDAGVSVGEMADYLEVDRNTVSRWTSDRIKPKRQTLVAWSLKTGVPLEWLEKGTAPDPVGPGGAESDDILLGRQRLYQLSYVREAA